MIRRIQALNYRCLRLVDVHLDSFHILVGPNASGKSTLLDVIGFLSDLVRDGLMEAVEKRTQNFQDLVWNRPKQDMGFELAVEFDVPPRIVDALPDEMDCQRLRYELCIREDDQGLRIDSERAMLVPKPSRRRGRGRASKFPEPPSSPKTILGRKAKGGVPVFSRSRNKVKFIVEGPREASGSEALPSAIKFDSDRPLRPGARGWRLAKLPSAIELDSDRPALGYLPGLLGLGHLPSPGEGLWPFVYVRDILGGVKPMFLDSLKVRQPSPPHLRRGEFPTDGSNLPWLVMKLQQEHRAEYEDWLAHVQTMLSDLEGMRVVEREEDRSAYLMLRYATGVEVPSWMVSDGTLRFLAITLIPYLPHVGQMAGRLAGQVYMLEEPENGVHPLALDAIYDSLSSAYDSQVFVATHSPAFLKLAEPSEVLCFAKDKQGATDVIQGDLHPILKNWQGSIDINALFATGIVS